MDWARDQLGRLVQASDDGFFSYGLRCPTCAEPVFRRAGGQRRPHFAHYGFGAKAGCELYRPVFTANVQQSYVSQERSTGFRGGIFLGEKTGGGFQLYLRLPRLESAIEVSGQIQIQTALGVRSLVAENLLAKQLVPLPPAVPLVEVGGWGMLSAVAESIRLDVTQFRDAGNVFRSTEDGGRLLSVEEPLELGQRYCMLGRQALVDPPADIELQITSQIEVRGWHFCEIELPTGRTACSDQLAESIGHFLGRFVRSARVRVWPVEPPPHHIEADGTLIYPIGTEKIRIRRSAPCEAITSDGGKTNQVTRVHWLSDEWGEIDGIGLGQLALFVGDQEQFCVRIEACEPFLPAGIQVDTPQGWFDLFDPRASCAVLAAVTMTCRLVCPNERIAVNIAIDVKAWNRSGETLTFKGTEAFLRVDAGGFGGLQGRERLKSEGEPSRTKPKQIWLEGVIRRLGNQTMADTLPWRTRADARGAFQLLASENPSWLRIYVKAAK